MEQLSRLPTGWTRHRLGLLRSGSRCVGKEPDPGASWIGSVRARSNRQAKPLESPFADAVGGLLLGSVGFVDRMRRLLSDRAEDRATPQLTKLRHRPPLTSIACVVAEYFGTDADNWQPESRHDDASRAVGLTWPAANSDIRLKALPTLSVIAATAAFEMRSCVSKEDLQHDVRKLTATLTND